MIEQETHDLGVCQDLKDLSKEIADIGDLITSTMFLSVIRQEVAKVRRDGFIVTDGRRVGASKYDIVISGLGNSDDIVHRIWSKFPDAKVERLANGVLGVNDARRGNDVYSRIK
jgi:hypothetical protein